MLIPQKQLFSYCLCLLTVFFLHSMKLQLYQCFPECFLHNTDTERCATVSWVLEIMYAVSLSCRFRVHWKSSGLSSSKKRHLTLFNPEASKFIWTGILFHLIYFYIYATHFGKYWISDSLTERRVKELWSSYTLRWIKLFQIDFLLKPSPGQLHKGVEKLWSKMTRHFLWSLFFVCFLF